MTWKVNEALGIQDRGIYPRARAAVEGSWKSLEAMILELSSNSKGCSERYEMKKEEGCWGMVERGSKEKCSTIPIYFGS